MPTDRGRPGADTGADAAAGTAADTAAGTAADQRRGGITPPHAETDQAFGRDASRWAPIEWKSHQWRSLADTSLLPPSARRFVHDGDYLAAVTHDIEHAPVVLSPMLSTLVTDASRSPGPTPSGPGINHFSAVLLRTESVASSKIENLSASARAIADAELTGTGDGNATLIVANTKAMTAAIDLLTAWTPTRS